MAFSPAFVPSVAPISLRSQSSSLNGVRPVVHRVARVNRRAVICAASPVVIKSDQFDQEVLQADMPVLVDFYADWCGPCKLVSPLMDWAATEFDGKLKVVKVDTENENRLVEAYNIRGLPTLAVFKKGEAFGVKEGVIGKAALEDYILKHAPEVA